MMTASDLSKVLGIGQSAIRALAMMVRIPYKGTVSDDGDSMCFSWEDILPWIKTGPNLEMNTECLDRYREILLQECPDEMRRLKEFGDRFAERKAPKRYYLFKVDNKKTGFLWYVKYLDNGRLVSSRWSTGTSDEKTAEIWALENRDRLLSEYYERKASSKIDLYKTLEAYYEKDSLLLLIDYKRGRVLSDKLRMTYHGFIKNRFVPYLKKIGIRDVDDIDTATLAKFQNYLLLENVLPQTVNVCMSGIKMAFEHFAINGYIKFSPCASLPSLKQSETQARGCYEIARLKGVFGKKWENDRHLLLCLLVYTTGMRNSEIARIQKSDIIEIEGCRFIDIPKSKSRNGVRVVPLHDFVHEKLLAQPATRDGYFFSEDGTMDNKAFAAANVSLAEFTGYDAETLEKERISFYSGRHFYKTLMNSEDLGEVEEYFMGHKVSGDIAKRYNHRDKQGKEKLAKKAREVFAVLDRCLFAGSDSRLP